MGTVQTKDIPLSRSIEERFWSNVSKGDADACWEWRGLTDRHGYGRFPIGGEYFIAHRVAARIDHRRPAGMCVLHKCDNPPCVNPAHLSLGSQAENIRDMRVKGRSREAAGVKNSNAKLTPSKVREIRRRALAGENPRVLGPEFGVSPSHIYAIKVGSCWSHLFTSNDQEAA